MTELDNEWSEKYKFLKTGEEGEIFKEGLGYSVESSAEKCQKESKVGA